jgi:hypothetical protein
MTFEDSDRVFWWPKVADTVIAAQKLMREYAAFEMHIAFVFDELGEAFYLGCERLIVLLHQQVFAWPSRLLRRCATRNDGCGGAQRSIPGAPAGTS